MDMRSYIIILGVRHTEVNFFEFLRFNAMKMVESLRNKRFLFVGDSLTRSQWASMACLLESPIPSGQKSVYPDGSLAVFKMKVTIWVLCLS